MLNFVLQNAKILMPLKKKVYVNRFTRMILAYVFLSYFHLYFILLTTSLIDSVFVITTKLLPLPCSNVTFLCVYAN